MMDISPLERAFAEERERQALAVAAAAAAASMASRKSPPLPPVTSATASALADHNGNDGNKAAFPFHPASLAAAFNLRPPPITTTAVSTSSSSDRTNGVLNLSSNSQKSSPTDLSEVESNGGSYKETDRSSPIKEGKSCLFKLYIIIQNSENRSFQDDITLLFKNIRLSRNDRILEVIFHFFHGYSKMIME